MAEQKGTERDSGRFADKVVLITGGTGSFGQTMAQRLLDGGCREVRILSRDEAKQEAMRVAAGDPALKFYIGDVRDSLSLDQAMSGVHLVFHAAALKQVPSCEFFPMQAVMTNVIGSWTVVQSAIRHGVQSVVCLSTDKAVYPVNAMGMTKALMEKIAEATARFSAEPTTTVSCVRYGNVMYSRGSVIPLFVDQIRRGVPLTLTAPNMTRFLLPLSQAVELVEYAFARALPGELFIRKAPACRMDDLAQAVKNVLGASNPVEIIGVRHGEKIYETLATRSELRRAEDLGDYFRIRMDTRGLQYDKYFVEGDTEEASVNDYTSDNAQRLNIGEIEKLLLTLPEMSAMFDGPWASERLDRAEARG